ncbi:hypothetical protein TKK_0013309 [Trichogramma kaykai]
MSRKQRHLQGTKAFLTDETPDSLLYVDGYTVIRNDREDKGGGGVAIYLCETLKIRFLAKSEPSYDNTPEYMILDIDSSYQSLLLAAVYMRPHCTQVASFFTTLSIFSNKYNHIVLTGDFNHNLLASNNSEITRFRKHVENLSLCIVPSEPTHHPMTKDGVKHTWLDLFIVDKLNSVVNYCNSTTPFIIAHDLIEINYKFFKPPAIIRSFTSRHLNRINDE